MKDLDKTLRHAQSAAPHIITPGQDRAHPLHPRPQWVRDGAQPRGVEFDMHQYARLMERINDWFAEPGRVDAWGNPHLLGEAKKELKPKKGQTKEELQRQREGKPADHMNLSTRGKALFARRLIIEWFKNPSDSNWPKAMIKKWETKTVRALIERYGIKVTFVPGLDDHLPASLKKKMVK